MRCSTCVRSILNACPRGPLASAGMTPLARNTEASTCTTLVWLRTNGSDGGGAASPSAGTAPWWSLRSRSLRARSRAFCRRSMLRLGRPDPRDHGQGRYLQQRNDVVAATDACIECFEQPHQAHGGTERQHDAQGQDQDAVRSDGFLRLYRRLDQREAFALAFGFQVFTELRFHLFLLHFGMLFLSALEVAYQRAVVALNHGCGGAALLELGQTRAKLCLLCDQRGALGPGLLAAGLDLNIGRVVRLLTGHGGGRGGGGLLELIFEQRDLSCETHHIRVVIGVYLARLGQIGACLLQFSLGIAITVLTAKLPLESRDLTLEPYHVRVRVGVGGDGGRVLGLQHPQLILGSQDALPAVAVQRRGGIDLCQLRIEEHNLFIERTNARRKFAQIVLRAAGKLYIELRVLGQAVGVLGFEIRQLLFQGRDLA